MPSPASTLLPQAAQEPHGEAAVLPSGEAGPCLLEPGRLKQTPSFPHSNPPRVRALTAPSCAGPWSTWATYGQGLSELGRASGPSHRTDEDSEARTWSACATQLRGVQKAAAAMPGPLLILSSDPEAFLSAAPSLGLKSSPCPAPLAP